MNKLYIFANISYFLVGNMFSERSEKPKLRNLSKKRENRFVEYAGPQSLPLSLRRLQIISCRMQMAMEYGELEAEREQRKMRSAKQTLLKHTPNTQKSAIENLLISEQ